MKKYDLFDNGSLLRTLHCDNDKHFLSEVAKLMLLVSDITPEGCAITRYQGFQNGRLICDMSF